jgi:hypothetical protein
MESAESELLWPPPPNQDELLQLNIDASEKVGLKKFVLYSSVTCTNIFFQARHHFPIVPVAEGASSRRDYFDVSLGHAIWPKTSTPARPGEGFQQFDIARLRRQLRLDLDKANADVQKEMNAELPSAPIRPTTPIGSPHLSEEDYATYLRVRRLLEAEESMDDQAMPIKTKASVR